MINIVEYVEFLYKHNLTANQFLLMYLLMLKKYELLYKYITGIRNIEHIKENFQGIPDYEINDLIDRKYIIYLGGDKTYADAYMVLDKFSKHFNIIEKQEALEFWNEYPELITTQTASWRGRNMNKDAFVIFYNNLINHNKDIHNIIMKTLRYEKQKGIIKEGMQKWLERRSWESFDENKNVIRKDLI